MKLNDILVANDPLKRLSEKRFSSYKKMRELAKLRKAVDQELSFYATEEKKAISVYAEVDESGSPIFLPDGRLRLKDAEAKITFEKEISALRETEIDGITPVSLCERDFRSADDIPTVDDMIALEGIIVFED